MRSWVIYFPHHFLAITPLTKLLLPLPPLVDPFSTSCRPLSLYSSTLSLSPYPTFLPPFLPPPYPFFNCEKSLCVCFTLSRAVNLHENKKEVSFIKNVLFLRLRALYGVVSARVWYVPPRACVRVPCAWHLLRPPCSV